MNELDLFFCIDTSGGFWSNSASCLKALKRLTKHLARVGMQLHPLFLLFQRQRIEYYRSGYHNGLNRRWV